MGMCLIESNDVTATFSSQKNTIAAANTHNIDPAFPDVEIQEAVFPNVRRGIIG